MNFVTRLCSKSTHRGFVELVVDLPGDDHVQSVASELDGKVQV